MVSVFKGEDNQKQAHSPNQMKVPDVIDVNLNQAGTYENKEPQHACTIHDNQCVCI